MPEDPGIELRQLLAELSAQLTRVLRQQQVAAPPGLGEALVRLEERLAANVEKLVSLLERMGAGERHIETLRAQEASLGVRVASLEKGSAEEQQQRRDRRQVLLELVLAAVLGGAATVVGQVLLHRLGVHP